MISQTNIYSLHLILILALLRESTYHSFDLELVSRLPLFLTNLIN